VLNFSRKEAAKATISGTLGSRVQAYQFTQEAIVKLPPFQIGASTPGASSAPPARSRLDPNDVVLLNLYSRAYCAYIDRPNKKLHLYLFFKSALNLQKPTQSLFRPGTPALEDLWYIFSLSFYIFF
jgi:hypothetical protein